MDRLRRGAGGAGVRAAAGLRRTGRRLRRGVLDQGVTQSSRADRSGSTCTSREGSSSCVSDMTARAPCAARSRRRAPAAVHCCAERRPGPPVSPRSGAASDSPGPRRPRWQRRARPAVGAARPDQHPALHAARRHGRPARLRHGAHPARAVRLREGRVRRLLRPHGPADPRPARRPRHPGVLEPRGDQRRPGGPAHQARERRDARAAVRRGAVPQLDLAVGLEDLGRPDERRGRGREGVRAALRLPQPRPRVHHRPRWRADPLGGADLAARPAARAPRGRPLLGLHRRREHRRGRSGPVRDRGDPRGAPEGPPVPRQGPRRQPPGTCATSAPASWTSRGSSAPTRWRSTSSRTTPPTSPRSPRAAVGHLYLDHLEY